VSTSFGDGHNPATNPISYTVWVKTHTNSGSKMFLVQGNWDGDFRAYFGFSIIWRWDKIGEKIDDLWKY